MNKARSTDTVVQCTRQDTQGTIHEFGIVVEKGRCLTQVFKIRGSDIDDSEFIRSGGAQDLFYGCAKGIGRQGWVVSIATQRYISRQALSPRPTGEHFDMDYYISFTCRLAENNEKNGRLGFRESKENHIKKQIALFVDEIQQLRIVMKSIGPMRALNATETAEYLGQQVRTRGMAKRQKKEAVL